MRLIVPVALTVMRDRAEHRPMALQLGPFIMGLTLAHLQATAAQLTALGDYPDELGFQF